MKKYFWGILVLITYCSIELLSYGGLYLLGKDYNIQFEPADVLSTKHAEIINDHLKQNRNYTTFSPALGWTIKNNGTSELYQANSAGMRSSRGICHHSSSWGTEGVHFWKFIYSLPRCKKMFTLGRQ